MVQSIAQSNNPLKWVGMEKIALPIKFPVSEGQTVGVNATVDVFVSLDTDAKGIHMSRLYLKLQQELAEQTLTFNGLCGLLEALLASQNTGKSEPASNNVKVQLKFDLPLLKPALLSGNSGFQAYPVQITQQLVGGHHKSDLSITIPYSSTCPSSAALARALLCEDIARQFEGDYLNKAALLEWIESSENPLATPHNQRSYAYINLALAPQCWLDIPELIFELENIIGTPVQTAVKREDEQAFARLNGNHLMFCEDAARKLDGYLNGLTTISGYSFKVEHQESLHAHNAVVTHQKQQPLKH